MFSNACISKNCQYISYQFLSIALERNLYLYLQSSCIYSCGACSTERKRGGNHRCESTGANFPCGGTKPRLRSSRVRSCRKNALGRSAVLAENSTCRPDGVAGRLNRTISSRTNCLDGRSVAAGASCAKWLFANEAPGTERGPRVRDEARREERSVAGLLARPCKRRSYRRLTGPLALEVS